MDTNALHRLVWRYLAGEATAAERRALQEWYAANFEAPVDGGADVGRAAEQRIRQRLHARIPALRPQPKRVRQTGTWIAVAMVTAVVGLALSLLGTGLLDLEKQEIRYVSVKNPTGQVKELRLPDGTAVWLNAHSELAHAENFGQNRSVILDGEGYFDVVADETHPFIVQSGKLHTTVLGTAFAVTAYPDEDRITVAVAHGKVAVSDRTGRLATLQPLDQVTYDVATGGSARAKVALPDVLALKTGELRFRSVNLHDITKVLERRYGVAFEFSDPGLAHCVYSAAFEAGVPLARILPLLCSINDIAYQISADGKVVTLSGMGC